MSILQTVSTANVSCEFSRKFFKLLGERLCWNHFCKVSPVEQQKKCLNPTSSPKILTIPLVRFSLEKKELSYLKTFEKSPYHSPSTGCSATRFELQTLFERCFQNVRKCFMKSCAIKLLFSKLQSLKLQPLTLCVLKITQIPEIEPTEVRFVFPVADSHKFSTE